MADVARMTFTALVALTPSAATVQPLKGKIAKPDDPPEAEPYTMLVSGVLEMADAATEVGPLLDEAGEPILDEIGAPLLLEDA